MPHPDDPRDLPASAGAATTDAPPRLPRWASGGDAVAAVVVGALRLSFVALGEGRDGDFDADDPSDVELLRLDLLTRGSGRWVVRTRDDESRAASFCTLVPANTPPAQLAALLTLMANAMTPTRIAYFGMDRIGQIFSHCDPAWLEGSAFAEHLTWGFGDIA